MPRFARSAVVIAVVATLAGSWPVLAQSTQPADPKPETKVESKAESKAERRAEKDPPMVAKLRAALADVGLTDEQKPKVDAILDDAAKQARQLREEATKDGGNGGDKSAVREKAAPIVREIRQKLMAVLTDDQKQKLAEKMPRLGGPGERDKADKGDKLLHKGRRGRDDGGPTTQPSTMPTAANDVPDVGDPAPAFTLTRVSGSTVTNKSFAGRPLVLVFASVTSPTLRDRLPLLANWQTHNRGRASLLLVYTREAHPADGWTSERNTDEGVDVKQAYALSDRQAAAKKLIALSAAGNRPALDVAIDGMDDATAVAFGASSDVTLVLSPAGRIVARQRWCDPSGFNGLVAAALKPPATEPSDDGLAM